MPIGDEAVRAFRKYARLCPDSERISYFDLCKRVRGSLGNDRDALKILSVYDTLKLLEALGNNDAADAVREVYFYANGKAPRKNEISYRVRRFAMSRHMDERTVWRRLGEAKSLYINTSPRRAKTRQKRKDYINRWENSLDFWENH